LAFVASVHHTFVCQTQSASRAMEVAERWGWPSDGGGRDGGGRAMEVAEHCQWTRNGAFGARLSAYNHATAPTHGRRRRLKAAKEVVASRRPPLVRACELCVPENPISARTPTTVSVGSSSHCIHSGCTTVGRPSPPTNVAVGRCGGMPARLATRGRCAGAQVLCLAASGSVDRRPVCHHERLRHPEPVVGVAPNTPPPGSWEVPIKPTHIVTVGV
jgi:hypothetical protein